MFTVWKYFTILHKYRCVNGCEHEQQHGNKRTINFYDYIEVKKREDVLIPTHCVARISKEKKGN